MSNLTRKDKSRVEAIKFLARFLLLSAPLYLVIWSKFDFFALQSAVAAQVAFILNLFGVGVSQSQYLVKGGGFTLEIVEECTGWRDVLAFAALVIASRGKIKQVFIFAPLVYFVNLLRLAATFVIGVLFPDVAAFFHNVVFEVGMLAFVFALWLVTARPLGKNNLVQSVKKII